MIRHIVLVRFDSSTSEDEKQGIFADLSRLGTVIAGMSDFKASANTSPEGLDRGYTHAFTIDFTDEASRDSYLAHADHQAAGARLVRAAKGGIEDILVIDLDC